MLQYSCKTMIIVEYFLLYWFSGACTSQGHYNLWIILSLIIIVLTYPLIANKWYEEGNLLVLVDYSWLLKASDFTYALVGRLFSLTLYAQSYFISTHMFYDKEVILVVWFVHFGRKLWSSNLGSFFVIVVDFSSCYWLHFQSCYSYQLEFS